MNNELINKIKNELEKASAYLKADGGDIEFVDFNSENGLLKVKLSGTCVHCPMRQTTLKKYILTEINKTIPEIKTISDQ